MSCADPTLVKAAVDACDPSNFYGGLIDGKSCVLAGGVWDVSESAGDTMRRQVFYAIKGATVNENFTITLAGGGVMQLVELDGRAELIDPP